MQVNFINPKLILLVFLLILCSAFIPFFKTLTIFFATLFIVRANLNQVFIIVSWVNFFQLLNYHIVGYTNSIDIVSRIIITILGFFIVFLKFKKTNKNFNIIFKINSYVCLSLLLITFLHIKNELFFLSFFKLILFYFASSFSFLIFDLIKDLKVIASWMFALFINTLVFSVGIYLFYPAIGYLVGPGGSNLFHGVFVHPNKISIFLLPFFVMVLAKIVSNTKKKQNLNDFITLSILIFLFFFSGARGIIASLFIGFMITFIVAIFNNKYRNQLKYIFGNIISLWPMLVIFIIVTIFFIGQTPIQFINNFILKGGDTDLSLTDIIMRSRGWRMMISYEAFLDHPWIGIGFGQPTPDIYAEKFEFLYSGLVGWQDTRDWITFDPIFGLPISAPVEKGVFITAILEEIGILGTALYTIFYFKWSKIIIMRSQSIFNVLLFFTIFSISLFEFIWFSIGSSMFLWFWLGYLTSDALNN